MWQSNLSDEIYALFLQQTECSAPHLGNVEARRLTDLTHEGRVSTQTPLLTVPHAPLPQEGVLTPIFTKVAQVGHPSLPAAKAAQEQILQESQGRARRGAVLVQDLNAVHVQGLVAEEDS